MTKRKLDVAFLIYEKISIKKAARNGCFFIHVRQVQFIS